MCFYFDDRTQSEFSAELIFKAWLVVCLFVLLQLIRKTFIYCQYVASKSETEKQYACSPCVHQVIRK